MATIVIPARLDSTRFPRKVLELLHGKTVLEWVIEACVGYRTIVATPDPEIVDYVRERRYYINGNPNLTGILTVPAPTVLDTCSQVAMMSAYKKGSIMVVQGDEPMVKREMIEDTLRHLDAYGDVCLVKPITAKEAEDKNTVKVITNTAGNIWYMSRYPIPGRTPEGDGEYGLQQLKQVCVMAFAPGSLGRFSGWARSGVERSEGIDLLRFIHQGQKIRAVSSYVETHAVDVPEDIELVERLMKEQGYV